MSDAAKRARLEKALKDARARIVRAPTGFDHMADSEVEAATEALNTVADELERWKPRA